MKPEDYERQIKIKDAWCNFIWMIGCDYDGCGTVKSLKELVDELVDYANKARACDDKTVASTDGKYTYNIIHEKIGLYEDYVKQREIEWRKRHEQSFKEAEESGEQNPNEKE